MKALSILQPWPWAMFNLAKDIENRTWRTSFRGRFLIHTGKGFDHQGCGWLLDQGFKVPPLHEFPRGGIVGSAVLRDCVQASDSPWFFGPFGFVLQGVASMEFVPYRGERGWFDVPDDLVSGLL